MRELCDPRYVKAFKKIQEWSTRFGWSSVPRWRIFLAIYLTSQKRNEDELQQIDELISKIRNKDGTINIRARKSVTLFAKNRLKTAIHLLIDTCSSEKEIIKNIKKTFQTNEKLIVTPLEKLLTEYRLNLIARNKEIKKILKKGSKNDALALGLDDLALGLRLAEASDMTMSEFTDFFDQYYKRWQIPVKRPWAQKA